MEYVSSEVGIKPSEATPSILFIFTTMCLNRSTQSNPLMVADEDIECYKVLTFRWEDRNKFKTKLLHKLGRLKDFQTLFQDDPVIIGEVVNASPVLSQFELDRMNLYNTRLYGGFIHSYKHLSDACESKRYSWCKEYQVIVKCIIPKGTYYFTGTDDNCDDNYASCAIKYVKIVNKAKVKLFT